MLVTGSSDGIGQQTALELARRGIHVVVHGRDPARTERAASQVRAAAAAEVSTIVADLSSLAAVRAMADEIVSRFPTLSVLINNAGLIVPRKQLSADGFELTFAVNHLAHFLLTERLLPTLMLNAPARVITVSSGLHGSGRLPHAGDDLDEAALLSPRDYDSHRAYSRSKQANVLFAVGLSRRLDPARVTSNALEPGVIATKMLREGFGMAGGGSLAQGAATSVHVATDERLAQVTGRYFARSSEARASFSEGDVEPLWELSERLCARWL